MIAFIEVEKYEQKKWKQRCNTINTSLKPFYSDLFVINSNTNLPLISSVIFMIINWEIILLIKTLPQIIL